MKQKKMKAFTLVELIVVIIILAILWTIAFISLQGYSKDARDATRISDIATIKSWLELFQLDSWKYPLASDAFEVTYSWTTVWSQWIFWENTFKNVDALDKAPVDPLTNKSYTYSVTLTRQEYQIAGMVEWELVSLIQNTYAWDIEATAIVSWNYNGVILKTLSWADCNVLSLPSIISNQESTTTDLNDILNNQWLVYNWSNNLPSNYRWTKYKADGWFAFTSNKLLVYSDTDNCSSLHDSTSAWITNRSTLMNNIKTAYSGTLLENSWNIWQYTNLDLNDLTATKFMWWVLVNNLFSWKIDIGKVTSTKSCAADPWYSNTTYVYGTPQAYNVAWQNTNASAPCYYSCDLGYSWVDCSSTMSIWTEISEVWWESVRYAGTFNGSHLMVAWPVLSLQYKTSNTYSSTTNASYYDWRLNTWVNNSTHPAWNYCANLVRWWYDDWYLPAGRDTGAWNCSSPPWELQYLFCHRSALWYSTWWTYYLASNQMNDWVNSDSAVWIRFSDGHFCVSYCMKTYTTAKTRCVRRTDQ